MSLDTTTMGQEYACWTECDVLTEATESHGVTTPL